MDDEVQKRVLTCLRDLLQNYSLSDIEELIIEDMEFNHISEQVQKELEKFIHLESLQLCRCQLKSLDNLPRIESLMRFCLDHNQLSGRELTKLSIYPNLVAVSIIDNKFESIDDIKQLALCPNICQINVYKNVASDQPKFREEIFEQLSGLILLDNLPKNGDEIALNAEINITKSVQVIGDHFKDEEMKTNKQVEITD